jgi:hypothetical protein
VPSSFAFLLAALMAFRRWRQAGGDDIASLRLIIVVAAVGLRSFAFHAVATLGAAVLDVGPIAVFICSAPFVALHRFVRLSPSLAVGSLLAFVALSTLGQRRVPTGILNGSIGYVARSVRCAWWRPWRGERANRRDRVSPGKQSVHGELVGCCSRHRRCLSRRWHYDQLILSAGPCPSAPASSGTSSRPGALSLQSISAMRNNPCCIRKGRIPSSRGRN